MASLDDVVDDDEEECIGVLILGWILLVERKADGWTVAAFARNAEDASMVTIVEEMKHRRRKLRNVGMKEDNDRLLVCVIEGLGLFKYVLVLSMLFIMEFLVN